MLMMSLWLCASVAGLDPFALLTTRLAVPAE